jgi:hypothetical protein
MSDDEAINPPQDPVITAARWILVLPAAIAAGLVASFCVMVIGWAFEEFGSLLVYLRLQRDDEAAGSGFYLFLSYALSGLAEGFCFIAAGIYVAPRLKSWVGYILAGLALCGMTWLLVYQDQSWLHLVQSAGWLFAIAACCWALFWEDNRARQ